MISSRPSLSQMGPPNTAEPTLSVVIPTLNEQDNIDALLERLVPVLDGMKMPFEVIFVDDGSTDGTARRIADRNRTDDRIKLVRFSRNFGKEAALNAGLFYSRGKAVIQLDADLQHPPEVLDDFVALWRNGNDIVYGKRASRAHEGLIRRVLAKSFYKVFGIISHVKLMEGLGDFVLLDRKVVNALLSLPERERFTKGLYAWVGFQRASVTFEIGKRLAGRSGFNLRRLMHFAMDAITGFGSVPLKVWSFVGLAMAISAMALGGYFILEKILWGSNVPGYPSLMAAICFFAGVQLIGLGIVGEYLSRVLMEVKQRPLYLVQEHVGFEEPATKDDGPATIRRVAV